MRAPTPAEQGMVWDEAALCWVEPEPAPGPRTQPAVTGLFPATLHTVAYERPRVRGRSQQLRQALAGVPVATPHELTRSSVIHTPQAGRHGNFLEASYRRILAQPAWARRLHKAHTSKRGAQPQGSDEERRAWNELDAATSSDALLMNIFCYPRVLAGRALPALLGVERNLAPEFGYRPGVPLMRGLRDRTEIDMRLGTLLVEAKLTESGFGTAPARLLERYAAFAETFDAAALRLPGGDFAQYQLVRGILAAAHTCGRFCLMADARRTDLLEAWRQAVGAVVDAHLRTRLGVVTWQEIGACLPGSLQAFLAAKYGVA